MTKFKIAAVLLASVFVSACAQQQEEPAPTVVAPEPVYDKYGNPV